jgi:thiamine-phosphate pyrophosphorylase
MTLARGLYAITDNALAGERLLAAVAAALASGAVAVQYRDKSGDLRRREAEAAALLGLCRRHGRPLLINDDVALAGRIGADGVHLGRSDTALADARRALGPDALIGATCHGSLAFAAEAAAAGASYLAFGAVFASTTKPGAAVIPLETLTAARRFNLPVVAIGGITRDNAPAVIAAGADCVAVIGDLWAATDIAAHTRDFTALF